MTNVQTQTEKTEEGGAAGPGHDGSDPRPGAGGSTSRLVGTIIAASLNNAPLSAVRLVLPMIALDMGAGPVFVGLMASLITIAPMLFSVRFGKWIDRGGAGPPFLCASIMMLLAAPVFFAFPNKVSLLVIACLIGAGSIFSHLSATRAVAASRPQDERTRNIAYLIAAYSFSQFLGPMLAGTTYEHFGHHMALLAIVGFVFLAVLVLASRRHLFVRELRKPAPALRGGAAIRLLLAANLRNKVIVSGTIASSMTLFPLIVSLHSVAVGISPTRAGLLLGAFSAGTLAARASAPIMSRYFGPRELLLLTFVAGGLLLALFPMLQSFGLLSVLSGLLGLNLGFGTPVALSLIYGAAPPDRVNEVVGLNMAVTNFLQTAAPLSLGIVAGSLGIAPMVWAVSLVMFGVALVALRPRRRTG